MTIYEALKAARCEIGNHESDLHVRLSETAGAVIRQWREDNPGKELRARAFASEIDGRMWVDIPFAYDPFWSGKVKGV